MMVIIFSFLILINVSVEATSLWDEKDTLYTDKKANQVGDLITIIIQENTTASQQASTDASQSSQASVGAGTGIFDFIKAFGVNESDNSSATGVTSRSGSLNSKLTVTIGEKLPNGNFKISGKKEININEEKQLVELTGIVRPEDITSSNTIDSAYVADVKIDYSGKGVVGNKQKQGIITTILDWIF